MTTTDPRQILAALARPVNHKGNSGIGFKAEREGPHIINKVVFSEKIGEPEAKGK